MIDTQPAVRLTRRPSSSGFSLVEVIAVIAIIAIMMAMIAPTVGSFSSTAGRKGAVNILMNTLEQARAAALETGSDIYVLLWRREYPDRDAIMVVREPSPWLTKSDGSKEDKLVPLTKWMSLPEGVLLHKPDRGGNVFDNTTWPAFLEQRKSDIPMPDGQSFDKSKIGYVWFAPNGSIPRPTGKEARIVITEGVRGQGGTEAVLSGKKQQQGGFEVITLSRFTGRAQLDVTVLN